MKYTFQALFLLVLACPILSLSLVSLQIRERFVNLSAASEVGQLPLMKKIDSSPEVSLILTGDVMLGRSVMQKYVELGQFNYSFEKVADRLKNADLVFVNLENPVVKNCPVHTGGFKFCSPPESVDGLIFAGVDVVSLANNHTDNYGPKGLEETVEMLGSRGISTTGLGKLVILERGKTTFGFLGFDKAQQSLPVLTAEETKLVKDSDSKVDILVVGMHWGVEYQDKALPGVRSLAKDLVASGADVVVGHHPHWVQDYELIDGKSIYYSLGNFVFDQMWSEETKKGLVVELTYKNGNLFSSKLYPTYMSSVGQPVFSGAYLGE